MARVTGHISLRDRESGSVWYLKYRLADGRQVQRKLGPAWTDKGRPPAGYFTRKTAEDALREILADARRGTLPDSRARSGKTFGDACAEWLRYVEHDKQRAPSTLQDYGNVVTVLPPPRVRPRHAAGEDHDGDDRAVPRAASGAASSPAARSRRCSSCCSGS